MKKEDPTSTRCPDFEVADPKPFSRDLFRPDDALDGFILALALASNDFKDAHWLAKQLQKGRPAKKELSGYYGQWHGMSIYTVRLRMSILHEVLQAIKEAKRKNLLDLPLFKQAISTNRVTPLVRKDWIDLVALAHGEAGADEVRIYLERVRHNLASHYYQPKALQRGFAACFGGEVDEFNETALAS